jgi:hypothetical protein
MRLLLAFYTALGVGKYRDFNFFWAERLQLGKVAATPNCINAIKNFVCFFILSRLAAMAWAAP